VPMCEAYTRLTGDWQILLWRAPGRGMSSCNPQPDWVLGLLSGRALSLRPH
jgi:hypothetical protein